MARKSNTKWSVTAVGIDQVSPAMRAAADSFVSMAQQAAGAEERVASAYRRTATAAKEQEQEVTAARSSMERFRDTARSMASGASGVFRDVALAATGAGSVLLGLAARALTTGDELDKLAERAGVTAGYIAAMRYQTEQAGGRAEDFDDALLELQQRAVNMPKDFQRWGVAVKDSSGNLLSAGEIMDNVANKLARTESQTVRVAMADELMSDAGRRLVPLLQQGAAGLAAKRLEAERLGVVLDGVERQAIRSFNSQIKELAAKAGAAATTIGSVLAPAMGELAKKTGEALAKFQEWLRINRSWLQSGVVDALTWIADNVMPGIAVGATLAARAFLGVVLTVDTLKLAFSSLWSLWTSLINKFFGALESIPGFAYHPIAKVAARLKELSGEASETLDESATESKKNILETTRKLDEVEARIGAFAASGAGAIRAVAAEIARMNAELAAGVDAPSGGGRGKPPPTTGTPGSGNSGQAELDALREKLRQEMAAIDMMVANEARVDAIRDRNAKEEERRQQKLQSEYQRTASVVASNVESVMGTMMDQSQGFEDRLKSAGKQILQLIAKQIAARLQQHLINQMTTKAEIGAAAAKTAAEGGSSQAGIPIIGPILAIAASTALFAAMMAFASKFQRGGLVPGAGRGDTVPAMLEPGEFVVPRELVVAMAEGRPPNTSRAISDMRSSAAGEGGGGYGGGAVVLPMMLPTMQTDFDAMLSGGLAPALERAGFRRS